jgi:glycosyltransferase involved in cell wall biosynthesis
LNRKLNILILSPWNCPDDVGEAWSNFQWIKGLSEFTHLTVLYLKAPHQKELKELIPNIKTHHWTDSTYPKPLQRFRSMFKPDYLKFFFLSRKWIKEQKHIGFSYDLIHHLSPLALRYPSPAVGLGIPYIIGPLGGSLKSPEHFDLQNVKPPWYTKLRNTDQFRLCYDPWLHNTYKESKMVIGVAPYIKDILKNIKINKFRLMSETGSLKIHYKKHIPKHPLKLLYVGRIIRTKGLRDLIQAIKKLNEQQSFVTLDVFGKGEDLDHCEKLSRDLKLTQIITFHGQKPKHIVEEYYASSHIFTFPSFREPSGNVVFEAMSYGLAMIVADRGGPGYIVQDDCGFKIKVDTPEQFINDIAEAIKFFINNPHKIDEFGHQSQKHIEEKHLWPKKIKKMLSYYEEITNAGQDN